MNERKLKELKDHCTVNHMRTLDRASARVSSWPQWKQDTLHYRRTEPTKSKEMKCDGESTNKPG